MGEKWATILFADIAGCAEVSNHHDLQRYSEFLKQFHEAASEVRKRVLSRYSEPQEMEFSVRGDEVCLILHKGKDAASYFEDMKRGILYAIFLKLGWLLSDHNQQRIESALLPMNLGIGIHHGPVWVDIYPCNIFGKDRESSEGYSINFAKRVEGCSRQGTSSRIFLSQAAKYLADEAIQLDQDRQFDLKGISPDPYLVEVKDIDVGSILKRTDFEIPHGWLPDSTLQKYIEVAQIHSGTEQWLTRLLHLYLKGLNEERSLLMLGKMYFNRGCTLGKLGDHKGAIENYEIAVEVKPDWEPFLNMSVS